MRKEFIESLELSNNHSQFYRVAQRFSLLAVAGELGIKFGILPWLKGDADEACLSCFKAWQANWGCGSQENRQVIVQIRKLIQEYGLSRFPLLEEQKQTASHNGILWGFRAKNANGELEWLILNEIFKNDFCNGFEPRNAIKSLKEAELIILNNGESTFPLRVPHLGLTRVVKLKTNILL